MLNILENNNIDFDYIDGAIYITVKSDDEVNNTLAVVQNAIKKIRLVYNISIRGLDNNRFIQVKINNKKSVRVLINTEETYIQFYPNLMLLRSALYSNKQKLRVLDIKVICKLKYKSQYKHINDFIDTFIEHAYLFDGGYIWKEEPLQLSCKYFNAVIKSEGASVKVKISNYNNLADVINSVYKTLNRLGMFNNIIIEAYDEANTIQLSMVILLYKLYIVNFGDELDAECKELVGKIDELTKTMRNNLADLKILPTKDIG